MNDLLSRSGIRCSSSPTGSRFIFPVRIGFLARSDTPRPLSTSFWHDGLGLSLYAKRLERGRFIWPSPTDGAVAISAAQLGYLLDGIDWRNPRWTFRPTAAG